MDNNLLVNMIEKYKNWLIVNGVANHTLVMYIQRVNNFISKVDINNVTEEIINSYLLELKQTNSPSTVNGYNFAIRSFLKFLKKDINLPKPLKIEQKLPEFITEEFFETEVIPVSELIFGKPEKVRAILYFLFYTGIRLGELVALRRENIDLKNKTAKIHDIKNRKEKIVLFTDKVQYIIRNYFVYEPENNNAFNTSEEMVKYYFKILKPHFKSINLHVHCLRHSFGTHLRKRGFSIEDIKELMGHKSIMSTMRYAHADIDNIKEMYDKKINKRSDKLKPCKTK